MRAGPRPLPRASDTRKEKGWGKTAEQAGPRNGSARRPHKLLLLRRRRQRRHGGMQAELFGRAAPAAARHCWGGQAAQ